jgi:hypothetical protein
MERMQVPTADGMLPVRLTAPWDGVCSARACILKLIHIMQVHALYMLACMQNFSYFYACA